MHILHRRDLAEEVATWKERKSILSSAQVELINKDLAQSVEAGAGQHRTGATLLNGVRVVGPAHSAFAPTQPRRLGFVVAIEAHAHAGWNQVAVVAPDVSDGILPGRHCAYPSARVAAAWSGRTHS